MSIPSPSVTAQDFWEHRLSRQYRTKIVPQMRCQIFRQIIQKFQRHTDVCRGIFVQDDGKYASRCGAKPQGGLCAVLPQLQHPAKLFLQGKINSVQVRSDDLSLHTVYSLSGCRKISPCLALLARSHLWMPLSESMCQRQVLLEAVFRFCPFSEPDILLSA